MDYRIHTDKHISAAEFGLLMASAGWGADYDEQVVLRSLAAYPFVAHARSAGGDLIGYVSAFSDGAFSVMLGELVIAPSAQRHGIGTALLAAVERAYPDVPVYVKALGDAKDFFASRGYRPPAVAMHVLFKKNKKQD